MQLHKTSIWFILPVLAACSREPSEQDLQQAYQKSLEQTNQLSTKIGAKQMQIQLQSFKKLGCDKPDQDKRYHCRIQVELHLPIVGNNTQQGDMTVQQQDNQWTIVHY